MNKRFLAVAAFAFVVALIASYVVYRQLEKGILADASKRAPKVLVAARDLPVGTLLKSEDLKTADWQGTPPAYAIVKPEEAIGRGVIANIYAGEPLNPARLAAAGAGGGMAATIPMGKRAVAVRVNDVVGVAGFVSPGMRVDLRVSPNQVIPTASSRSPTQTSVTTSGTPVGRARVNVASASEDVIGYSSRVVERSESAPGRPTRSPAASPKVVQARRGC